MSEWARLVHEESQTSHYLWPPKLRDKITLFIWLAASSFIPIHPEERKFKEHHLDPPCQFLFLCICSIASDCEGRERENSAENYTGAGILDRGRESSNIPTIVLLFLSLSVYTACHSAIQWFTDNRIPKCTLPTDVRVRRGREWEQNPLVCKFRLNQSWTYSCYCQSAPSYDHFSCQKKLLLRQDTQGFFFFWVSSRKKQK